MFVRTTKEKYKIYILNNNSAAKYQFLNKHMKDLMKLIIKNK